MNELKKFNMFNTENISIKGNQLQNISGTNSPPFQTSTLRERLNKYKLPTPLRNNRKLQN